jgi:hypothetical protein
MQLSLLEKGWTIIDDWYLIGNVKVHTGILSFRRCTRSYRGRFWTGKTWSAKIARAKVYPTEAEAQAALENLESP